MKLIKEVANKIKGLEIQGATNIALKALNVISEQIKELTFKSFEEAIQALNLMKDILFDTRPTEPAMRNGIRFLIYNVINSKQNKESIGNIVQNYANEYINMLNSAKEKIGEIGSNRITNGMQILTHCHSSVVTKILKTAFKHKKDFEVVCTETRPLYQGHITAKELIETGIKTTMIVDSAMRWAIKQKEIDLIIVGADAVTSEGVVINKIGTRLLALAAHEYNVPFYVATPMFKFDPETIIGKLEQIEMRASTEVWQNAPDRLHIENPAFETVSRNYIDGLITEIGVIPPSHLYGAASEKYPFIFEG